MEKPLAISRLQNSVGARGVCSVKIGNVFHRLIREELPGFIARSILVLSLNMSKEGKGLSSGAVEGNASAALAERTQPIPI